MTSTFHHRHSGYRDAANDQASGNDAPPDDDLVSVLATRASVLEAVTAMGHKAAGDENGGKSNRDDGAQEQTTANDKKRDRDKGYRKTERGKDAEAGIKPCPVKLPVDLHQSLRQRVNDIYAPEGSRSLLAFASFTLRPELTDILHAIELHADRDALLKALQSIVQIDWLTKTAIRLSDVGPKPPTPLHRHIPRLVDAAVRSPGLINAILAVTNNPTLQKLCIELGDKGQMQRRLLHLATRPSETEFLVRMSSLITAEREFLLTLLNFDPETKLALADAARYPEITRLVVSAGRDLSRHSAIRTVANNPAVASTGLAVINGMGLVGWIARKAVRILLRRQQI